MAETVQKKPELSVEAVEDLERGVMLLLGFLGDAVTNEQLASPRLPEIANVVARAAERELERTERVEGSHHVGDDACNRLSALQAHLTAIAAVALLMTDDPTPHGALDLHGALIVLTTRSVRLAGWGKEANHV